MRIVLLGKDGQVGSQLQRTLAAAGEVVPLGRAEADLSNADALGSVLRKLAPALIVNAAAYTQVDRAEDEPEMATRINRDALAVIGAEAKKLGAGVVHYSTDYVFDGGKAGAYVESDSTGPLNVYGRTKLEGEKALAASGAAYLVLRTSWVYAAQGNNFMLRILELARSREEIRVVTDQVGAPTWSRMIAAGTAAILATLKSGDLIAKLRERQGVYHLSAAGSTSWFGFAEAIVEEFRRAQGNPSLAVRRITPIASAEFPTRACRPANSVLANDKVRKTFGVELPGWREQLGSVMRQVCGAVDTSAERIIVANANN
ncbi:MAG: dTDP-4-dehydrorhamnose reductase [Acidobacteriota bacterium]|nr:dTDP-4-dehydrorhamnose reductase [Acidobacteriota bacterium]